MEDAGGSCGVSENVFVVQAAAVNNARVNTGFAHMPLRFFNRVFIFLIFLLSAAFPWS